MKFAEMLNRALSPLNLAITRKSTLDRVLSELHESRQAVRPPERILCRDELAARFASIMARLEDFRCESLRRQIASKWEIIDFLSAEPSSRNDNRSCALCGYQDRSDAFKKLESQCIFGGGFLRRHQCPRCDVVFGPDKMLRLSGAELQQEYEWHYKAFKEGDSTEREIRAFESLSPSRGGTYLNFGAGAWSRSVQILRSQGWNVFAFEPHASASVGGEFVISTRSALSQRKFDGIFSNNVLEHLRHPIAEIEFLRGCLHSGGRMSHATPCFEYLFEFTRFHLFFFLDRSREVLAEQAGLSIVDYIVDGEFMNIVLELPGE